MVKTLSHIGIYKHVDKHLKSYPQRCWQQIVLAKISDHLSAVVSPQRPELSTFSRIDFRTPLMLFFCVVMFIFFFFFLLVVHSPFYIWLVACSLIFLHNGSVLALFFAVVLRHLRKHLWQLFVCKFVTSCFLIPYNSSV